ncbi:hypothetical protein CIPAW_13G115200 [Carya illinoinensis]|uniref:TIR domain-containing protein n=2 Tax=Carya illinoinensis TaxID=32201 RepID=A0A8T1NSC0_CARIL|nr:hypothetical protein CIPAW_13G115200 [Carya illinoinensis]
MATQRASTSTSKDIQNRERALLSCSEKDENIRNSSSSSSTTPRWKHDVFLSFCGKDTRKSFTDHLYVGLKRKGILVFKDGETLKRGEFISKELLKAIRESIYTIIIISQNYASSKWCLMELAAIVEWAEKTELTILPIFYHVNPTDVRNLTGSFEKAFTAHENNPKVGIKKIQKWKNAFREVGNIAGWDLHDRYESALIQEISGNISRKLNCRISRYDYKKHVAMNSRVEEMLNLLDMESNDVRFIGIHGMGGVGKTTLAEIIYDRISCQFEGSSFISCIREESRARGLASLQKQLLSMIMQEEIYIWDHHQGIKVIRSSLHNKKAFIVLDDVDSEKQLMALSGSHDWFGPGSRVIITCRDSHLLKTHEVNDIYKVEQLETTEALQLFSLSAFKHTHPRENYKDISMDFVNYAQGLPLALKFLGSFLFGRTIDAWKSARDQLEAIPNKEIMNILQISFEGLEDLQKELFLDMACLFRGHWLDNKFLQTLESFGYYPGVNIDILIDKSLVRFSNGMLFMHDLLQKMGQEIVRRECLVEPGRRSRLCHHKDVFHVLKNNTGTDAIEGIVLDFCPETKDRFNTKAFSKMRKLRFLKIHHSPTIEWRGDPLEFMPTYELRFLDWFGYPWKSLPSSFQPKTLTVLSMPCSHIKQLWKGLMVLDNLKYFDLSYSRNLIETPDLTGAPNLEKIFLSGCRSLCKVHASIGFLKRLKVLNLDHCECLRRLPNKFCLESLEVLSLTECSRLEKFPDFLGDMTCLESLVFSEPTKTDLPSSFMSFCGLRYLHLQACQNISVFPSFICSLSYLESLRLDGWSRLEKFPDLSRLECLTHLTALGTAITQIPSVNLIPKSIRSFQLEGRKWMPHKSRDLPIFMNDYSLSKQSSDPTYNITSLVDQYQMDGMYKFDAEYIDVDSEGENKLHLAGGGIQNSFNANAMIYGWSLGSGIPKWVHNKSNGSSLKIDLDGNMKGMGCAIYVVCDYQQFHSLGGSSISSLFKDSFFYPSHIKFTFCFETDTGYVEHFYYSLAIPSLDISFIKPIGLWSYIPALRFLESSRSNKLDQLGFIKIFITANMDSFRSRTPIEVKECGVHLVCPDDANSKFYNSIIPLGLGSSNLNFYRRFYFTLYQKPPDFSDELEVFIKSQID